MPRSMKLVLMVLLLTALSVGTAMADELQFGGGSVAFTGTGSGVNMSINSFTVQFSDPSGDTAVGSTVQFGSSQPVAFFGTASGSSVNGSVYSPETLSITGAGGTLTGNIQTITLTSTTPGVFGLNVLISPVFLSAGATSTVLNEIYDQGGAATISFQFSNSNYSNIAGLTSLASGATAQATASGSIAEVPEPSSMMLLGAGIFGLGAFRKRFTLSV